MKNTAESILKHGRSAESDENMLSIKSVLELIPGTSNDKSQRLFKFLIR